MKREKYPNHHLDNPAAVRSREIFLEIAKDWKLIDYFKPSLATLANRRGKERHYEKGQEHLFSSNILDHPMTCRTDSGALVCVSHPYDDLDWVIDLASQTRGLYVAAFGKEHSWYFPGRCNLVLTTGVRNYDKVKPIVVRWKEMLNGSQAVG